jgi:branched-chain amino acid transport system permease protein
MAIAFMIIFTQAFIFATLLAFLTLGFNLTYLTARIPNWAHGSFAALGVYITLTVTRVWNMNPYYSIPISFFVVGLLGISVYLGVVYTLKRAGAPEIILLISTLAVDIVMTSSLNIIADYLMYVHKVSSRIFILRDLDIEIFGLPGILVVAPTLLAIFTIIFSYMLYKTKFGMAMRGTVESPELASILGINTDMVNLVSWFITGGLAGISGALLPLWFLSDPGIGTMLIIDVFAASILGGIRSIYAAIIGSYIIGFAEVGGTSLLSFIVPEIGGVSVSSYRLLVPLTVLVITLMVLPRGLYGFYEEYKEKKIKPKEVEA